MKNKVQHSKTGIKKKIELMESNPNKVKMTSDKRPPLKAEILEKLSSLQEAYDALDCENKKNVSIIETLQEEVTLLRNQKLTKEKSHKGSQTFTQEIQICCNVCIYVATCEEELNWHMGDAHDLPCDSFFDKDFYCEICSKWFSEECQLEVHAQVHNKENVIKENATFYCNFCDDTFKSKNRLMEHKKRMHAEKVTSCWKFEAGTCDFSDFTCWFSHCQSRKDDEGVFKCSYCEKEFKMQLL